MKLITKGLINKVVEIDDEELKAQEWPVDSMHLAFRTRTHPYRNLWRNCKSSTEDPNLFIVHFQKIL